MGTAAELERLKNLVSANEGASAAYANGVADGHCARASGLSVTIYLQVGIDDYSKGFRAGYFDRGRKEPHAPG